MMTGQVFMETQSLLEVKRLQTAFRTDGGIIRALDGVSFGVAPGKTLAVVGESGCGKSVTAMSIMGLVQEANGFIESGEILFKGKNLAEIAENDKEQMRTIRGNDISMIFQEPMTALNPVFTVGDQISEVFRIHRKMSRSEARKASLRMLEMVSIPDAEKRLDEYPFQLSGGMRQRIVIAMALACEPELLIADEPTTALDVTIQAQILRLMKNLQNKNQTSIIFITHDLGVVAEIADYVVVMYAGKAVEYAKVEEIFANPQHPYTKGLIRSIPTLDISKDQKLHTIEGTVPGLKNLPNGCRFNTRCSLAAERCFKDVPVMEDIADGHQVACHKIKGASKA